MGLLTSFLLSATLFLNLPDQHLRLTSQNAITSWHTEVLPCQPGAYQLTGELRTEGEPLIDGGALIRVTFPSYTPVPWYAATTFPEVTNGEWHRFRLPFWAPSKVKDIKVEGIFRYVAGTAEFRNLKIERFSEVTPYRAFAETSSIKINETVNLLPGRVYAATTPGLVVLYDFGGKIMDTISFKQNENWFVPEGFAKAELMANGPIEIRMNPIDPRGFHWREWNAYWMGNLNGPCTAIRKLNLKKLPCLAVARIHASHGEFVVNGKNFGVYNGKAADGDKCYVDFLSALKDGDNILEMRFSWKTANILQFEAELCYDDGQREYILSSDGQWTLNGNPLEYNTSPYTNFINFDKPWLQPPEMPERIYNVRKAKTVFDSTASSVAKGEALKGILKLTPEQCLCFPTDKIALDVKDANGKVVWRQWLFPDFSLNELPIGKTVELPFELSTNYLEPGEWTVAAAIPGATPLDFTITGDKKPVELSSVKVDFTKAIPMLEVNGEKMPMSIFYSRDFYAPEKYGRHAEIDFHQFAESGVRIITATTELGSDQEKGSSIRLGSLWIGPGEYTFAPMDTAIKRVLSGAPDSKILLMLSCDVPLWYKEKADPSECIMLSDGTVHHSMSMASDIWANDTIEAIKTVVRHIKEQPYASQMIGVFLVGGYDGQWLNYHNYRPFYWMLGDYSPVSVRAFREYLRKTYGNDAKKLQKAWHKPEVTFETANIPTQAERLWAESYYIPPDLNKPRLDYYTFLGELNTHRLNQFGKAIKDETDGRWLVGTYYIPNHGDTSRIGQEYRQESRNLPETIDFMAQPQLYDVRELYNCGMTQLGKNQYFSLQNKLWVVEDDNRTFMIDYPVPRWGNYTVNNTVCAMKRHICQRLCLGRGHWYFDIMGNFYASKIFQDMISWESKLENAALEFEPLPELNSQMLKVTLHRHLNHKRTNTAEDIKTLHFYNADDIAAFPIDEAELQDLGNPALPNYKIYWFHKQFMLDDKAQKLIQSIKKKGNILMFDGDTGFSNGIEWSADNISRLTGIHIEEAEPGKDLSLLDWTYAVNEDEPLLRGIGGKSAQSGFNAKRFVVKDENTVALGFYDDDHSVAAAVRRFDDYTVIYLPGAFPYRQMVAGFSTNLAKLAGIHAYQTSGTPLVIRAGGRFVSVYCPHTEADATIHFPQGVSAIEVCTGKVVSTEGDAVQMQRGESRLYFCGTPEEVQRFMQRIK